MSRGKALKAAPKPVPFTILEDLTPPLLPPAPSAAAPVEAGTGSENAHPNTLPPPALVADKLVKVIALNAAEKAMNGAPDGDLYEVTVTEDEDLPAFSSSEAASQAAAQALEAYSSAAAVWAHRFEAVLTYRRLIVQFHPSASPSSSALPEAATGHILEELASLRSTSAKNALLAVQRLLPSADDSTAVRLLLGLGNRLFMSGPKFLGDLVFGILHKSSSTIRPCQFLCLRALLVKGKNAESIRKIASLLLGNLTAAGTVLTPAELPAALEALADCMLRVSNQTIISGATKLMAQQQFKEHLHLLQEEDGGCGGGRRKAVERMVELMEAKR